MTTVLTVTTASDSGAGSLRQALLDAASPKTPTNFEIDFAIPGSGIHAIKPTSSLPVVPLNTTISGWTQPGYSGSPLIEINGSRAGTYRAPNLFVEGLILKGGDGVYGLTIDGFAGDQVLVAGPHSAVQGDDIGVGPSGETVSGPGPDQAGISVLDTGDVAIGGRLAGQANVISGNHWGIFASNDYRLDIEGNAIGLDATRAKVIANGFVGIELVGSHDSIIGGSSAASANQIDGSEYGIYLTSNSGGPHDYNDRIIGNNLGVGAAAPSLPYNSKYDLFLDFNTNTNTITGNTFGPVAASATSSLHPPVRDVNPGNVYAGNVGFDATKQQVNVGVTSSYIPAKSPNKQVYSFTSTFAVTNQGSATATGITLEIAMSPGSSFQVVGYAPTSQGTFDPAFAPSTGASTYLVRFDSLAPGQSASVTLDCVNPSGTLAGHLAGSVASDGIDAASSDKHGQPF